MCGNDASSADESFQDGLLEGRVDPRPSTFEGAEVPEVLRGGDHARIARWRRDAALRRTAHIRPDLLARLEVATLDARDLEVLGECGWGLRDARLAAEVTPVADL